MKISDIDPDFKTETVQNLDNVVFLNPAGPPFSVHGVFAPDENENYYRRLPNETARAVSEGVKNLSTNTAGGRIRFCTDSPFVALKVKLPDVCVMNHMALAGIGGFSLYTGKSGEEVFAGLYMPSGEKEYTGVVNLPEGMNEVTVYMPLYNNVSEVLVGVAANSEIKEASPYKYPVPVVFYGSSITQGGCASRPGTDYQGFLSRAIGFDYINLGFSGNAKGETAMSDYIKGLKMSAFVLDYDHNAPTADHLRKTHEPFFKAIREANPDLPVIMISRPKQLLSQEEQERLDIIRETYLNAKNGGDEKVWLIDGTTFFDPACFNDPTVDGCHPTDLGFFLMAKGIEPVLRECLK